MRRTASRWKIQDVVWINEAFFAFSGSGKHRVLGCWCSGTYRVLAAGGLGGFAARESRRSNGCGSVERSGKRGRHPSCRLQRSAAGRDGGQEKTFNDATRLHSSAEATTSAGSKHSRGMRNRFFFLSPTNGYLTRM